MYKEKKILAVIPARGGSKGVSKKNIRPVLGVPIIAMAGLCAKKVSEFDRVVVSTDSDEIAKVSKQYDIDVPFIRSSDKRGDVARLGSD